MDNMYAIVGFILDVYKRQVIPELRLTDRGLFDVVKFAPVKEEEA